MNLETKITIYKFTPQVFTLTRDCGTASYQGAFVYLAVAPCQVYVSEKN